MPEVFEAKQDGNQPGSTTADETTNLFLEDIYISTRKTLRNAGYIASGALKLAEMLEPAARTSGTPVGNLAADLLMASRISRNEVDPTTLQYKLLLRESEKLQEMRREKDLLPQVTIRPDTPSDTRPELNFEPPAKVDVAKLYAAVEKDPQYKRLSDKEEFGMNTPMERARLYAVTAFPSDRESQALFIKVIQGKGSEMETEELLRRRDAVWEKFKKKD